MLFKKYVIVFLLLFFALSVAAQKRKGKVYSVDFEDEFIEGHIKNPTIFHLFNKQQLEYDKLVDLKEDFLPEMRRTAGEIE
ncbi:MAG: hypothetical protein OXK80_06160 [Bdellovibrionales bacterium]|nr:hypothetical protein [Bdellovibrionales bacterium]